MQRDCRIESVRSICSLSLFKFPISCGNTFFRCVVLQTLGDYVWVHFVWNWFRSNRSCTRYSFRAFFKTFVKSKVRTLALIILGQKQKAILAQNTKSRSKNIKSWLDWHPYCRVLRHRLKILNFLTNLAWDPRTFQSQLNSQISFLRSSGFTMSSFIEKLKILIHTSVFI